MPINRRATRNEHDSWINYSSFEVIVDILFFFFDDQHIGFFMLIFVLLFCPFQTHILLIRTLTAFLIEHHAFIYFVSNMNSANFSTKKHVYSTNKFSFCLVERAHPDTRLKIIIEYSSRLLNFSIYIFCANSS
jgi:hypothetical protein